MTGCRWFSESHTRSKRFKVETPCSSRWKRLSNFVMGLSYFILQDDVGPVNVDVSTDWSGAWEFELEWQWTLFILWRCLKPTPPTLHFKHFQTFSRIWCLQNLAAKVYKYPFFFEISSSVPEVCHKSYPTAVVFNLFIANPGIPRHELITSSESSHRLPMVAALGRNYLVYPLVDDDVIPHPDLQLCRPGKLAAKPGGKVPVGTMSGSSNPLFWQLWPLGASTRAITGCFRILPSFFLVKVYSGQVPT